MASHNCRFHQDLFFQVLSVLAMKRPNTPIGMTPAEWDAILELWRERRNKVSRCDPHIPLEDSIPDDDCTDSKTVVEIEPDAQDSICDDACAESNTALEIASDDEQRRPRPPQSSCNARRH